MLMNRRIVEAMARVSRAGHDARFTTLRGSVAFKVAGIGNWRLCMNDGHFDMSNGDGDAEADVVLSLDQETFVELLEGRQNFLTGVLQGRIRADGDLALALRLRGIFPLGRGPSAPSCKKVQP
jgi:putative sterol carrier protein